MIGRFRDAGNFVAHAEDEIPAAGRGDDVADRCAHQAGGAGEGREEYPLLPHILHDGVGRLRSEIAAGEGVRDGFDPITHLAVPLAEAKRLHRRELDDLALVVERHCDGALAAEYALAAEFRVEHVEVPHAVEHRNDRRLRAHRRGERLDGIIEIEGLAAQEDDVERLLQLVGLNRRRVFKCDVAMRAFDDETGARQFGRALRPHQKSNVASGLQQPAAKIAADRAGSHHENTHRSTPLFGYCCC